MRPMCSPTATSRRNRASASWALMAGRRRRQSTCTGGQSSPSSWRALICQLGTCSLGVSRLFATLVLGGGCRRFKVRVGALKVFLEWLKTRYGLRFFTLPERLLDYLRSRQ